MIRRMVERLTARIAAIGAIAIAVIMLLTVADVALRTLTDRSIEGVVEVAPLLLLSAVKSGETSGSPARAVATRERRTFHPCPRL